MNQIAAGEVIERPASVVKELVENALDAGAGRIEVELEHGGIELIRITDDGCGITADELVLAVAPHATSKIAHVSDLDCIATMGFRGEALASIASVSRLALRSRMTDDAGASVIESAGDETTEPRPAAGPVGTSAVVRNLFFNTPARRKFLRTVQTEFGHCQQVVRTLAMSHPAVGFRLTHDGRIVLELSPEASPRRRVVELLGTELEDQLVEVSMDAAPGEGAAGGLAVWGLVGRPSLARNTTKAQHVFLNGRPIRDKSIQHAMREAYRGLIEPGRHPTAVLFLEIDPSAVDVNVHPAKAEVRFRDQSMIHGSILRLVKDALAGADLTPDFAGGGFGTEVRWGASHGQAGGGHEASAHAFVDHFKHLNPLQQGFVYREVAAAMSDEAKQAAPDTLEFLPALVRSTETALQVHNSFIVTEDADGLVIIDQHALHERIMFEMLKERIATGPLESQRLLMPETFDVTPEQAGLLEALGPLLKRIGIEAEPIGPTTIAVHAFASFLFERKVEILPFMTALFDVALSEGFVPSEEGALHDVLDMMACKAAVKAGDTLRPEELEELLRKRDVFERSSNCPHGRPTTIRITLAELERQFGRR